MITKEYLQDQVRWQRRQLEELYKIIGLNDAQIHKIRETVDELVKREIAAQEATKGETE